MDLIFLGTGGAVPTKKRNLPSTVVTKDNVQILIDCGEDVQRRFEAAALKFNINLIILISHMHGDHVIGLPGLLFHFGLNQRSMPVIIFGPPGIYFYLFSQKLTIGLNPAFLDEIYEFDAKEDILKLYHFHANPEQVPKRIKITDSVIFENSIICIKSERVLHSVDTWGFRIEEKAKPGKFNPDRALELGISDKRLWKNLQMSEKIKINGRIIDPVLEKIVGPSRPGIILSYSSDTAPSDGLNKLAELSDYFICESTYSDRHKDLAESKKHLTAKMAAELALKNNVKQLILTHFSSRYDDPEEMELLLKEAKEIFPNTILAEDLMKIHLKKEE